jgi:predicted permease
VGATSAPPLGGHSGYFFEAEGVTLSQKEANQVVLRVTASPGYFEAIGMTLLDGRPFTPHDGDPKGAPSAIVNESFARRYWPGASAIGKHIRYSGSTDPWMEVIGVSKDEKHYGLDQPMRPSVFVPMRFAPRGSMALVLRTAVEPASLTAPARDVLRQMDADLPMYAVRTMQDRVDRSLGVRRGYSWLFGAFAAVALLLAAAGIYGVISYAVSQRTQEIGIRIALGAQPGQVMGEVLRSGMLLVSVGVVLGLAGALGAARLLESLLFGVSWHDLRIYGAVIAGVALVGLAANLLPARRAATVDPIRALRFE